ncbi:MAG TPA: hypothetical protein VKB67_11395 [Rhizomicrobium sp.]|nr:hypothetical protein [Rhizomicrobium sp.]
MSNFSIWVLVAGENDALICASDADSSRFLRVVKRDSQIVAGEAGTRAFAWQLMTELLLGAQDRAYDGVIVMAGERMLRELQQLADPEVKTRLVAAIVRPPAEGYAIPIGFENYVAGMPALGACGNFLHI